VKILVVEDEAVTRRSFAESLRLAGHDVTTEVDGLDALNNLVDGYDMMFVDLVMPRVNGLEFVVEAKRSGKLNCPVVMVTVYYSNWKNHVPEVKRVLEKPVTARQLVEIAQELEHAT